MSSVFIRDNNELDELQNYYKVRVKKSWFRGKDVFTRRLSFYEKQLMTIDSAVLPLNAGNMIYTMMQRLEVGVEWEKQSSLMSSYRNLVYRLSYTTVSILKKDPNYLLFEGQKSDVMWTLCFITQVFFEDPIICLTVPFTSDEEIITFAMQNGEYVGKNAIVSPQEIGELPDIWAVPENQLLDQEDAIVYNPKFEPQSGDIFAIPDGRVAQYVRMDERFYLSRTQGTKLDTVTRHNISASLIKDFEDIIHTQTQTDFETYQLRYVAFMNKVHELEKLTGGFEPTVYDVLPICERGLPLASVDTLTRTNAMDCNSLKYISDSLKTDQLGKKELKMIAKNAAMSVLTRQRGYETEYRMYLATGTPEEITSGIFKKNISDLYNDFARLDALKKIGFPPVVYKNLCNVPSSGGPMMTDWERQRIKLFGKGYLDFLTHNIKVSPTKKKAFVWITAKRLLDARYMKNPNRGV